MTKEESSQIGDNWIRRGFAGGGSKNGQNTENRLFVSTDGFIFNPIRCD